MTSGTPPGNSGTRGTPLKVSLASPVFPLERFLHGRFPGEAGREVLGRCRAHAPLAGLTCSPWRERSEVRETRAVTPVPVWRKGRFSYGSSQSPVLFTRTPQSANGSDCKDAKREHDKAHNWWQAHTTARQIVSKAGAGRDEEENLSLSISQELPP